MLESYLTCRFSWEVMESAIFLETGYSSKCSHRPANRLKLYQVECVYQNSRKPFRYVRKIDKFENFNLEDRKAGWPSLAKNK